MDGKRKEALAEVMSEINERIAKLQQLRNLMLEELDTGIEPSLLEKLVPPPPEDTATHSKGKQTREKQLVSYLSKHGPAMPGDVKRHLNVGWSTVYYLIKKKGSPVKQLPDGKIGLRADGQEAKLTTG